MRSNLGMLNNYEEAMDRLYMGSPDEFVELRKQLAGELKDSGEDDSSAKIKEAKKPSVAAWALNQISRRNPDQLESLFEASETLAGAKGKAAREAAIARHHAVSKLVEAAASYLEETGRSANASMKEKITETLYAVATDEEARSLLERGWLTKEVKSGSLGGLEVVVAEGDQGDDEAEQQEAARIQREEEVRTMRAEAEKLSAEADRFRSEAEEFIRKADDLNRKAEDLKKQSESS
jgi:hypothetical protein